MLFLKLDEIVFGKTNDTSFLGRAQKLFSDYRKQGNSESAVSRNTICYAVLYEVTTSWYRYDSMTNTWRQLSDTHSYQWGDTECVDIGGPSGNTSGNNSGGGTSSGGPIGNSSPPSFTICEVKLEPLHNGYYININNLRIDFLHRSTGRIIRKSISVCIQIPKSLGIPGSKAFIKNAFRVAGAGTEAQLTALYPHNPNVSSSTIDILFKQQLLGQITGRFGSYSSVSSYCPGVPSYSPTWGC